MIYGVIDVGSNSVRLMISDGTNTKSKRIAVTRLAENLIKTQVLSNEAIERTANAVSFFVNLAKESGVDKTFVFATAAVRNAKNGSAFVDRVKTLTELDVDVLSGKTEAKIGVLGALNGKDGGIIDVGGASSEIAVIKGEKRVYAHSLNWGAVTLTDKCGQDVNAVCNLLAKATAEYGNVPKSNFYGVGGTATSMASILIGSKVYLPEKVNGYVITRNDAETLKNKLYSMTVEERKSIDGLMPERAEIISAGVAIICAIMDTIKIDAFTVSESDNLEGYLYLKRGLYE